MTIGWMAFFIVPNDRDGETRLLRPVCPGWDEND